MADKLRNLLIRKMAHLDTSARSVVLGADTLVYLLVFDTGLISYLLLFPQTSIVNLVASLLSTFIIPSASIVLLLAGKKIDLTESVLVVLLIGPLLGGSVTIVLSSLLAPLSNVVLLGVMFGIAAIPLAPRLIRREGVSLSYCTFDLWTVTLLGIAAVAVFFLISIVPHYVTPDENFYISDARMLSGQATFLPIVIGPAGLSALINSRLLWSGMLAALFVSSGISPGHLGLINLLFTLGIAVSSLVLLPARFKNNWVFAIIPFTVFFSPILMTLSGSVLDDVAIAFYNVAALVLFLRSFKPVQSWFEVDLHWLSLTLLLLLVSFFIKLTFIFAIPLYALVLSSVFRYGLYSTTKGKVVTLLLVVPVAFYELVLDLPYHVVQLWGSTALNFLGPYLPFGVVGYFIKAFVGLGVSSSALSNLLKLYTVMSPENLSLLVVASFVALPLLSRRLLSRELVTMAVVVAMALVLVFMVAVGYGILGDIPRYYAAVIAPMTVVSMILCAKAMGADHRYFLVLLVALLSFVEFNLFFSTSFGGVLLGYGILQIETFWPLFVEAVVASAVILLFATRKGPLRSFRFKSLGVSLAIVLLFAVALASNIYFSGLAFSRSNYYSDAGQYSFASNSGSLVFSNSYIAGTYLPGQLVQGTFYAAMPNASALPSVISDMPNGTRLYAFTNFFVNEELQPYIGTYALQLGGAPLTLKGNTSPPRAMAAEYYGSQLHFDTSKNIATVGGNSTSFNYAGLPVYVTANGPYAFYDGTTYAQLPFSSALNISGSFTVQAWIKGSFRGSLASPIADMSTTTSGWLFYLQDSELWLSAGRDNYAHTTSLKVVDGKWAQVGASFNGTDTTFYVNGASETVRGPIYHPIDRRVPLWIGRSHWVSGGDAYFRGYIAYVDLFDRADNQSQADQYYQGGLPPPFFSLESVSGSQQSLVYRYALVSDVRMKNNSDIKLDGVSWSTVGINTQNPSDKLVVALTSPSNRSVTVVLSTTIFSVVKRFSLSSGVNTIALVFPYTIQWGSNVYFYGGDFATASSLLMVDDGGGVVARTTTGLVQFSRPLLLAYGSVALALVPVIVVIFWRRESGLSAEIRLRWNRRKQSDFIEQPDSSD